MNDLPRDRLDPLTSLRFFAAAMIVLLHGARRDIGPKEALDFALSQGVSFFYVLSGFVLAYNYPRLEGASQVLRFYQARIARVWPLHVASALLMVLLIAHVSYFTLPPDMRLWITLAQLTMTHAWVPVLEFPQSYNTVSWSISTEWFFYLVFPWLAASWQGTRRIKLAVTLALAAAMWALATYYATPPHSLDRGVLAYMNPLARLFEFTVGIGTCHLYRAHGRQFARRSAHAATTIEALVIAAAIAGLWLSTYLARILGELGPVAKTASVVVGTSGFDTLAWAGMIFVFAVGAGALSRALRTPALVYLGEISFALYLVHPIFLVYRQQAPGVFAGLTGPGLAAWYWGTSLALAAAMHAGVERPARELIRNWGVRRTPASQRAFRWVPPSLFAAATGAFVVLQPSPRLAPDAKAGGTPLLSAPATFAGGYRLDAVDLVDLHDGRARAMRFSWTATEPVALDKGVAVHLLDGAGTMVRQLDHAMDTGYRRAPAGERWSTLVPLDAIDLSRVASLGLAVYDHAGLHEVANYTGTTTDWNGQRLRLPLAAPDRTASGR